VIFKNDMWLTFEKCNVYRVNKQCVHNNEKNNESLCEHGIIYSIIISSLS